MEAGFSEGEKRLFDEVIPLLDSAAEDLGRHIDFIAFCAIARRLASRGYDREEVFSTAGEHFDHQVDFERVH